MKVDVETPDDCIADVIADFNSRRGEFLGATRNGLAQVVSYLAPLSNMFGYRGALSRQSQGRARFSMQYDHYAPLPRGPDTPPDTFPSAAAMRA